MAPNQSKNNWAATNKIQFCEELDIRKSCNRFLVCVIWYIIMWQHCMNPFQSMFPSWYNKKRTEETVENSVSGSRQRVECSTLRGRGRNIWNEFELADLKLKRLDVRSPMILMLCRFWGCIHGAIIFTFFQLHSCCILPCQSLLIHTSYFVTVCQGEGEREAAIDTALLRLWCDAFPSSLNSGVLSPKWSCSNEKLLFWFKMVQILSSILTDVGAFSMWTRFFRTPRVGAFITRRCRGCCAHGGSVWSIHRVHPEWPFPTDRNLW